MKKIVFAFLCVLAMTSCKQNKSKQADKEAFLVKKELSTLEDSVKTTWQAMMKSDDQKISDMKRLLQEFEVVKNRDESLYSSLVHLQTALSAKRYNEETMQSSARIDAYDQATDSLMRGLSELVATTPSIENYPLCKELMKDIQVADNEVFAYRVKYDNAARQYNTFITENATQLKELGLDKLQEKPLFELESQ